MNILVTGATGFIGKNLCVALKDTTYRPIGLVRDSSNTEALEKSDIEFVTLPKSLSRDFFPNLFRDKQIEGIVHLATNFLASHQFEDIESLVQSNLTFGLQVLDRASQAAEIKWFLNAGTSWQHFEGKDYYPTNLYAATKEAFEVLARYYVETTSISIATLKLSDTYGPGDTRRKIFNLWKEIGKSQKSLDMSPGDQIIDICYIDDVVRGFVLLMDLLSNSQEQVKLNSYYITSPYKCSLRNLAEVFEKASGLKLNINWGGRPYREREVMKPGYRGEQVPGWSAKVNLESGIPKILDQ